MTQPFTEAELEAYIDEELDAARASELESVLRDDQSLQERLAHINARRNSGVHTLGEIWRRQRLCVPTREELGSYLLGVLSEEHANYIRFRLETLRCPITIANLRDLQNERSQKEQSKTRQQKIFKSSVGYLQD
jgi:hypothetical protein